jgi:hypothetical protein
MGGSGFRTFVAEVCLKYRYLGVHSRDKLGRKLLLSGNFYVAQLKTELVFQVVNISIVKKI